MKIHQYGTVMFQENGPILVEGWHVEREESDPAEATDNQLLLAFAIHWAQEKFKVAYQQEAMKVLIKWAVAKAKADEQKPS